jgi:hypothetical protein
LDRWLLPRSAPSAGGVRVLSWRRDAALESRTPLRRERPSRLEGHTGGRQHLLSRSTPPRPSDTLKRGTPAGDRHHGLRDGPLLERKASRIRSSRPRPRSGRFLDELRRLSGMPERGVRRPAYYPSESTVQAWCAGTTATVRESERNRERLSHAATERRSQAALRQRIHFSRRRRGGPNPPGDDRRV